MLLNNTQITRGQTSRRRRRRPSRLRRLHPRRRVNQRRVALDRETIWEWLQWLVEPAEIGLNQ